MYVHKVSGNTITDDKYKSLKDERVISKYSKVPQTEKKSTPVKSSGDSKSKAN